MPGTGRARRWEWAGAILAAAVLVAGASVSYPAPNPDSLVRHPGTPSAVLVDQVAFTDPDPAFATQSRLALEGAGYVVDYVPWQNATLGFYRDLPSYGYDVILLRSHSSATVLSGATIPATIFTTETATRKNFTRADAEGMVGLRRAHYEQSPNGTQPSYIAFNAEFVHDTMRGDFGGAVILMMGCQGLAEPSLAKAFLERGASGYAGWNRAVTVENTDSATLDLLHAFVQGNRTVGDAIHKVARMEGKSPDVFQGLRFMERASGPSNGGAV